MKQLLLVEDDPVQLELRQMLLQQHGYAVTPAGTRAEAEAALRSQVWDGVVMDLRIPTAADGHGVIAGMA
jgi:CheY-like chemotaxis protein